VKSAAVKSTTSKAAEAARSVEPAGHIAAMEAAASEAAATMEATTTAHAAAVASTASTTRQGHCWRSQANGRDCQ